MEYTQREIELMKQYQERTGSQVLYKEGEKYQIYKQLTREQVKRTIDGIQTSIRVRTSLDNCFEVFDSEDDPWKLKVLEENLEVLLKIRSEQK